MKLFDFLLIIYLIALIGYQVNSTSANSSHSNPAQLSRITPKDLTYLNSLGLTSVQIFYNNLGSTKIVLKNPQNPKTEFVAYLNPNISYSDQFDLIQKVQNSSKITSRQLLFFDLASQQPYVSLQSN